METRSADIWASIGSAELHALAERYGTPFYLYDADVVADRIRLVRHAFKNDVKVFYAVKANPNLELLRAVSGVADGLDISSGGELEQARLAGFDMARLSFAGPAKSAEELAAAIQQGVGCISIESLRELQQCVDISRRVGIRANIALRINPLLLNRSFGLKMGGRPVQFGIDEEQLGHALERLIANLDWLNFRGIHVYAGSQCFDAAGIADGVMNTLRMVQAIETSTSLACKSINLGGGFGVAAGEHSRELDIGELASALLPLLREFGRTGQQEREIVFELGRFLTANAGLYVTRVISSKESRGKSFYMVDGGLNHHLAAAGTFGAALRSNYALRNLSRPDAPKVQCSIAGPSCNPTDLLGIDVEIPRPELDDLIGVPGSGSYGFTASPLLFLGRRTPVELVRRNGEVVLGRAAKTIVDFN